MVSISAFIYDFFVKHKLVVKDTASEREHPQREIKSRK